MTVKVDSINITNICIYGVGGVGGYFGAKIASQLAQENNNKIKLFFIARGDHLHKIEKDGLVLKYGTKDEIHCRPTLATNDLTKVPTPDLYLVCVKSYDLNSAIEDISKNIKKNTIILPLLNGVDIYERIRTKLEDAIILPACVYIGTHIEKPGVISTKGGDGSIIFGKDPKFKSFTLLEVIDLFNKTAIKHKWIDDPYPDIWEKYIFIAAFGLITAYSNMTLGEIIQNKELVNITKQIMQEIILIARKKGINLPNDILDKSIEKANKFPFETKTSYQRDIESKGKHNEGNLFGDTIIKMGQNLNIDTPVTNKIFNEIQKKVLLIGSGAESERMV